MSKKPFTLEEYKDLYSKVPKLTVEVIVKTNKGLALTLRKLPTWNNTWHIPGGAVYYGEKLSESVQRIAQEELGIKVKIKKLIGVIEYLESEQKERGFGWSIGLAFLCLPLQTNMRPNEEASEIKLFKELPKNIILEHANFIKKHHLL